MKPDTNFSILQTRLNIIKKKAENIAGVKIENYKD